MFEKQISQQIDEALQPLKEELAELKKKSERQEENITVGVSISTRPPPTVSSLKPMSRSVKARASMH